MKRIFLILVFIIFVVPCMFISAKPEDSTTDNTVVIINKVTKKITKEYNFVGVNWFDYYCQNRFFLKSQSQLDELGATLKKYNIDMLRYPGGLNVLAYFWDIPNDKKLAALRNLPKFEQSYITESYMSPDDEMNFTSFMEFSKKNNLKSTIQINVHSYYDKSNDKIVFLKQYKYDTSGKRIENSGVVNWNVVQKAAKSAAEQVKWTKDNNYISNVKYWEMGNEDYVANLFLNCGYTGEEYAKVSAIFIKEMLKVDPSLKFMLTNAIYPPSIAVMNPFLDFLNKWTKSVINNKELLPYKKNIYSFSSHLYSGMGVNKDTQYNDFLVKNINDRGETFKRFLNEHRKALNEAGYSDRPIFVNEFNVNDFQNKYMHNWLSALSLGKLTLDFSNNPDVAHIDYHNLLHQWHGINYGFGLFNYAKDFPDMKFLPYPAASVLSFINQNFKGEVLQTTANGKYISAVASKPDSTSLNIIILNKSEAENLTIKLDGFSGYKYASNSVLGANLSYSFESFEPNDDRSNPSEVRLINSISNGIKVSQSDENTLTFQIPKNAIVSIKLER